MERLEDAERQPVSVLVLLQAGASAPRYFADFGKLGTMLTFMTANIPHPIALMDFDSRIKDQWDFSPDVAELQAVFDRPIPAGL